MILDPRPYSFRKAISFNGVIINKAIYFRRIELFREIFSVLETRPGIPSIIIQLVET